MGLLGLQTKEYEQFYSRLYSRLPALKVKFRDQLCVTGKKYPYEEVSKVYVRNIDGKNIVSAKIFTDLDTITDKTAEVDYIGLYAIGAMELLYLVFSKELDENGGESISALSEKFSLVCDSIFTKYEDLVNVCNCLMDDEMSKEYRKQLNLFYSMRTDFSRLGYKETIKYANWLMIIWLADKQKFWEIFFEIMEYVEPLFLILFDDIIRDEDGGFLCKYWLNEDKDLHFNRISYAIPNSDGTREITDCRGVAIFSSLSLYYSFLFAHGYHPSNDMYFTKDDTKLIGKMMAIIAICFGNDAQAKFLKGIGIDEIPRFDLRMSYTSALQNQRYRKIDGGSMKRTTWEDLVLFSYAYQLAESVHNTVLQSNDVNMYYASIDTICNVIGCLIVDHYDELLSVDTSEFDKKIKDLEYQNNRLNKDLETSRQRLIEVTNNSTANDEVNQLKQQLSELQRIVDSKTEIIEQLNSENKELNAFINNIYSDEDIDDEEEYVPEVPMEEMVEYLNNFRFLLVGGRFELPQKLAEYGWTNLTQFDSRKNLGATQTNGADFYVFNTKFISHKIVRKVESEITDTDTTMYYNGTNTEKLIESCYKFAKAFFED